MACYIVVAVDSPRPRRWPSAWPGLEDRRLRGWNPKQRREELRLCAGQCFDELGIKYYGGVNAPYTFVHFPVRNLSPTCLYTCPHERCLIVVGLYTNRIG